MPLDMNALTSALLELVPWLFIFGSIQLVANCEFDIVNELFSSLFKSKKDKWDEPIDME